MRRQLGCAWYWEGSVLGEISIGRDWYWERSVLGEISIGKDKLVVRC